MATPSLQHFTLQRIVLCSVSPHPQPSHVRMPAHCLHILRICSQLGYSYHLVCRRSIVALNAAYACILRQLCAPHPRGVRPSALCALLEVHLALMRWYVRKDGTVKVARLVFGCLGVVSEF